LSEPIIKIEWLSFGGLIRGVGRWVVLGAREPLIVPPDELIGLYCPTTPTTVWRSVNCDWFRMLNTQAGSGRLAFKLVSRLRSDREICVITPLRSVSLTDPLHSNINQPWMLFLYDRFRLRFWFRFHFRIPLSSFWI